jgi:hypothetical protein
MSTTAAKPSPPPVVQRALVRAIEFCKRVAAEVEKRGHPGDDRITAAWLREADEYRCFLAKIEPPKRKEVDT